MEPSTRATPLRSRQAKLTIKPENTLRKHSTKGITVCKIGTEIQRDFYSAFIEEHVDEEHNSVDFEACNRDFPDFYKMYQAEVVRLAAYKGYLPSSFGIKR